VTETPPSPEDQASDQPPTRPIADVDTVEALVRQQLSTALGGPRGVIEAAVPTAVFTIAYVISDELKLSLILAAALAGVALLVRLVQRSTVQFVLNAAFGIGIGAAFALRASGGDDKDDGALAYFLPGILYNTAYAVVLVLTVLVRWPLIGFMVGAVTGEPTAWRSDPAMVKLCQRLTLLLAAPCIIRVAVQYPLYEAGEVGMLGTAKVVMGWPLQVGALALMAGLLARGRTPLAPDRTD
jgi:hypothetical protein